MAAAVALAARGRGRTWPNPNVGCVMVRDGTVVGRGWTQPGGRPHAEAMALAEAGAKSRGATCYVTLEPCAHDSVRGPACSALLIEAGVARVVAALGDPDPRTDGQGFERLAAAGIAVERGTLADAARAGMAGWLTRRALGRPFVTLKLATSLDGAIALANGESRWITGADARAHTHVERARSDAILVGRGTWDVDRPALDVRLAGLEQRAPGRAVLSASMAAAVIPAEAGTHGRASPDDLREPLSISPGFRRGDEGVVTIPTPSAIADLPADWLLVEGGAATAAAFVAADLVDRLLLYRAPILIGGGKAAMSDIGLDRLDEAHRRWRQVDARTLGVDRLEVYERVRS